MEEERPAKRARLSLEEVITEFEEEDDQFIEYGLEVDGPMMAGSDDELEDLQFEERERENTWRGRRKSFSTMKRWMMRVMY